MFSSPMIRPSPAMWTPSPLWTPSPDLYAAAIGASASDLAPTPSL
jgi:hypothetical protein